MAGEKEGKRERRGEVHGGEGQKEGKVKKSSRESQEFKVMPSCTGHLKSCLDYRRCRIVFQTKQEKYRGTLGP